MADDLAEDDVDTIRDVRDESSSRDGNEAGKQRVFN